MVFTFKALKANRGKTALIFASLLFAVISIFLITAIAKGVIKMYSDILQSDGDIIVTQAGISDTFFSQVDMSLVDKYENIEGINLVSAMIVGATPVGDLPIAAVYGVSQNRYDHYTLQQGSYPKTKNEAMLGSSIYQRLQQPEKVTVSDKTFQVSGVYESGIGFEQGGVVLPLEAAGAIFHKQASMLLINTDLNADKKDLVARLQSISDTVAVKTTNNFVNTYNQFKIIETSSWVISAIAFVMGLLSIVSVMSISIMQRRSEFGIMRALGISAGRIISMLLMEGLVISLAAYIAGLLLSVAILFVIKHIALLQGYVNGEISPQLAIYVLSATVAMSLLGSILPALQAAKTDPLILIQGNKT